MIGSALPDFVLRGEMAALVRRFDWAATSLGPRETWRPACRPPSTCALASPMPIVLLCGEAGVMIYNDAYSVLAGGRHPAVLGMPCWRAGRRSPTSTGGCWRWGCAAAR